MKLLTAISCVAVATVPSWALFVQKDQPQGARIALLETSAELQQMIEGFTVDPTGDLLGNVATMITDTMMPGILSAHNSTQHQLEAFGFAFTLCPSPTRSTQAAAALVQSQSAWTTTTTTAVGGPQWIDEKMGALTLCRQHEGVADTAHKDCLRDLSVLEGVKNSTCNSLKAQETAPVDQLLCAPTDPYEQWLVTAKNKMKSLEEKLLETEAGCGNATQIYNDKAPKCAALKLQVDGNKSACDVAQAQAEAGMCAGPVGAQRVLCQDYTTCYNTALADYEKEKPTIEAMQLNWTVQWRTLKRMECLLGIMQAGGTNDDIDKCKEKTWPTDHLDLVYPVIPKKEECDGGAGSTTSFLQTEAKDFFHTAPRGATACDFGTPVSRENCAAAAEHAVSNDGKFGWRVYGKRSKMRGLGNAKDVQLGCVVNGMNLIFNVEVDSAGYPCKELGCSGSYKQSANSRFSKVCTGAPCGAGYEAVAGHVPNHGWRGNQAVADCNTCKNKCDSDDECLSYECSHSEKKCQMNELRDPTSKVQVKDYVFCSKAPPAPSMDGIPLPCEADFLTKYYGSNPLGAPAATCTPCAPPPGTDDTTTTTTPSTVSSGIFGGNGGGSYSVNAKAGGNVISRLCIWGGSMIDAVQLWYWSGDEPKSLRGSKYGGNGGGEKCLGLEKDEQITKVVIFAGDRVDGIEATTSKGKVEKWGGSGGGRHEFEVAGKHLIGIYGRQGSELDAFGVIFGA